jgi:hypothetical protein
MLNEINRRDVQTSLLGWISQLVEKMDGDRGRGSLVHEFER